MLMGVIMANVLTMNVCERDGSVVALDFSQLRHLLVAGGSAAERTAFFASMRNQVAQSNPNAAVWTISDCCDGAQYDLIEVLREVKRRCDLREAPHDNDGEAICPMIVLIEDASSLMKHDMGFLVEILGAIARLGESVAVHLVVGAGDTWRSGLPPQLLQALPSRAVFRCENPEGYRIALGRTVKTPPSAFEFYFVCGGGRTKRYGILRK